MRGLTDGFRDGVDVAHADRLVAFADAVVARDDARIATARAALLPLLGGAGVIDAAATVAAFHGFVRIADAIGIPHYTAPTGDDLSELREEAGVNGFYRELACAGAAPREAGGTQADKRSLTSTSMEEPMSAKESYRQKLHAQLLEWQADVQKLRALSEKASPDAQTAMQVHIAELDAKIDAAASKLLELADIPEDGWETMRANFESAWETLSTAVRDAAGKLKG